MRMNPDGDLIGLYHFFNDFFDITRHDASVCITENKTFSTGGNRSLKGLHRILGVCPVTVKEMLGIINNLRHPFFKVRQRIVNQIQVSLL